MSLKFSSDALRRQTFIFWSNMMTQRWRSYSATDTAKPSNMETICEQLLTWTDENHMAVNYSKTNEMIMGSSSITANLPLIKTTTGHAERANSTKLLGIHLDSNFSWQPHIEAILAKATQRLYFLKQLTRFLNTRKNEGGKIIIIIIYYYFKFAPASTMVGRLSLVKNFGQ